MISGCDIKDLMFHNETGGYPLFQKKKSYYDDLIGKLIILKFLVGALEITQRREIGNTT
jgi:hypothetical protein